MPTRSKVFVSYSHSDRRLFDEFRTMLAPAVQKGLVDLWADTSIRVGAKWREAIAESIASAKVAVLLVSPKFLESPFIASNELPPLLDAAEREGVTIFWVCLSASLVAETAIEQYQAAHDVGRPLDTLRKAARSTTWKEICDKLLAVVTAPPPSSDPARIWSPPGPLATAVPFPVTRDARWPNALEPPAVPQFAMPGTSLVSAAAGQVAPPKPHVEELFEIITDPDEVAKVLFGTEPRVATTTPYLVPYVKGREGTADVQSALASSVAAAGGRLLVCGRGGIGKTREVAEYATELCRRNWRICIARAEGDPRMGPVSSLPAELVDARVLVVVDNLHARALARFEGEEQPYADRLESFLASMEQFIPGDLRLIAIARSEPHFRKALVLEPSSPRWRQFGVYEMPDFTVDALGQMLTGLAARANVPLAAQAVRSLVENSDRTPETLLNNVDIAHRNQTALTGQTWLPTEGESWKESYRLAKARFRYTDEVFQALRLIVDSCVPARVAYVRTLSTLLAGGGTGPAVEGLVDKGLLGQRQDLLRAFSDEQLRESLDEGNAPAMSLATHHEPLTRAIVEVDRRPADWLRDLTVLANNLLRIHLAAEAETVARYAIAQGADFAEVFVACGRARFLRGHIAEASADFSAALERDPDEPALYAARAGARSLLGDTAGTLADLDRAIELDPAAGRLYGTRGAARFQQGRFAEAEADFTLAVDRGERDALTYFARGVSRYQQQKFADAEDDLTTTLGLSLDLTSSFDALAAVSHGDASSVFAAQQRMAAGGGKPTHAVVLGMRGYARMIEGKYAEAEQDLTGAIDAGFAGELAQLSGTVENVSLPGLVGVKESLSRARSVFLTDAPLHYMRGIVRLELGRIEDGEADLTRAIEAGLGDGDVYIARGRARVRLNQASDAEADFSIAVERGRVDARAMRGATRLDLGKLGEAEADLTAAIEGGASDGWIFFCRGAARMQQGNPAGAEEDFTVVIARGNADQNAWGFRAAVRLDQGKNALAEEDFTKALELGYRPDLGHFFRGSARYNQQRLAEAEADVTTAMAAGKQDAQAYSLRGAALLDQNKNAEAEQDFDRAIELGRTDGAIYFVRGVARYRLGRLADAETDLTLAIAGGKADGDTFNIRGAARFDQEKYAEAIDDYDEAIARGRDDAVPYFWRGTARLYLERYAEAEADFDAAAAREMNDGTLFWRRGRARFLQEKVLPAKEDFDTAIARGFDLGVVYYWRGRVAAALDDPAAAERDFTAAVVREPGHAPAFSERAHIRLLQGRMREAEEDFTAAIAIVSDEPSLRSRRGLARYAQQNFSGAAEDYEAALAMTPADPASAVMLALARIRLDQIALAQEACEAAAAASPDHPDVIGCQGVLQLARGEIDRAHARIDAAVRAADGKDWNYWQGLTALLAGQWAAALEAYRTARAITVAADAAIATVDLDYWVARYSSRVSSEQGQQTLAKIHRILADSAGGSALST